MVDIDLESIHKAFDDAVALEEVSLTVEDGEFFTLVGPSGCGKTTTLRTIAGLSSPTDGTVRFDGEDVSDVPVEDRNVGVVFQSYALFPHMTVTENIRYGLRFTDPPRGLTADERVEELLELVDLPGMGDREPDELSGGQQQRVALARALAPAPDVLLLDEPMSALDARLREQLRREIKRIQRELGVTTVYVTHDQEEALAVSDRLAVMNDGGVEQVGTPVEVYEQPATEFVASFVGENNVFSGVVAANENGELAIEVDEKAPEGHRFHVAAEDHGGHAGHGAAADTDADDSHVDEAHAVGDHVTFCVRPTNLDPAASQNRFPVALGADEYLGGTTRLYGEWAGREIVLRLPEPPAEDAITVGFDPTEATLL
ncbi:ABC transporter ATP-binding protein [Halolamina salifodinae]|uniref:Molybdate/tungstate import ATP-binding protein WtpC n=1 Tax=Halolamina salifodinae TaxID=1202767 RepID=A0A8T4GSL1_9EURY|nr:ABC transporter ATP-binding protein [Halolamina salifodinae]MBP1985859.1 thiamine transport system ATP-binding protein [Halolamina salifodinae]